MDWPFEHPSLPPWWPITRSPALHQAWGMSTFVARCRRRARWWGRGAAMASTLAVFLLAHMRIHSAVHSRS